MIKKAWAVWKGSLKEGGGTISTETGVLRPLMDSNPALKTARAPIPKS